MDQMPRNMFRGTARSFGSDRHARAAAKAALHNGWDLKIDEPARQVFYMPLMHSESLTDQDRAVRLITSRLPQGKRLAIAPCAGASGYHPQVWPLSSPERGVEPARNRA